MKGNPGQQESARARRIAVLNSRPGVGKTTTVTNLGHALASLGQKVMLLDLDPEGKLASALGVFRTPRQGLDQVLLQAGGLSHAAIATRELMELVPAGSDLASVEGLDTGAARGSLLLDALRRETPDMDYVLFDCPSSAGLLSMNALLAADEVLLPLIPERESVDDLQSTIPLLRRVSALRERPLSVRVFLNRFVPRQRESAGLLDELQRSWPDLLAASVVRESELLSESRLAGRTIFEYRAGSRSARDYRELADELVAASATSIGGERRHVA